MPLDGFLLLLSCRSSTIQFRETLQGHAFEALSGDRHMEPSQCCTSSRSDHRLPCSQTLGTDRTACQIPRPNQEASFFLFLQNTPKTTLPTMHSILRRERHYQRAVSRLLF